MPNLSGPWAGFIYGTNTGKLFVEFQEEDSKLSGTARLNDDSFGIVVFSFTGKDGDEITLDCTPERIPEGVEMPPAHVVCRLMPDGSLSGRWNTEAGTAGTLRLWPHKIELNAQQQQSSKEPEQIYNRVARLGSVRIFRDDVAKIVEIAQKDFTQGRAIVTYEQHGNEITKWGDDFLKTFDQLSELKTLKVFIQEPDKGSINRTVIIDLVENGENSVRASGADETWVVGKAESIRKALTTYENSVVTNYRKYGLNINFFIFLAMLIFMPDIPGWPRRLAFVAAVIVLIRILFSIHSKLIPNTLVIIKTKPRSALALAWPSILSWLITVTGSLVAALIFWFLTRHSH